MSSSLSPRADASSELFELVAVARPEGLRLYLDRFRGNVPVTDAVIEMDGPGGTSAAAAQPDGTYLVAAPWLATAGRHDLAFTVTAGGDVDVLTATLDLPAAPAAEQAPVGWRGRLPDWPVLERAATRVATADGAVLAGGAGFLAGLVVMAVARRRRSSAPAATAVLLGGLAVGSMLAPAPVRAQVTPADAAVTQQASPSPAAQVPSAIPSGRDMSQRLPDGAVFVPKATQRILGLRTTMTERASHPVTVEMPGRVIPDPSASGYVQASVSGRLAPPPGGFPRLGARVKAGDTIALVEPTVNAADATTQVQQARELDQQIDLVARRLERFRALVNVVARQQIEEAEIELRGLRARRASLDAARRVPEALRAPVAGVVAAISAVAGQVAEPNAVVAQIVDPERFWIEALSFEAHALAGAARGRLADGRNVVLAYRGTGLADRNQAIPVQFAVEDAARLRAGQFVTVLATTAEAREGLALPRAAVIRGPNGQSIVFEHGNAERFTPREVRVEPLDGDNVLVVSGLERGRRVVVQGAELLNQIR